MHRHPKNCERCANHRNHFEYCWQDIERRQLQVCDSKRRASLLGAYVATLFQFLIFAWSRHTPFAGSANREKGVTIDLQSLNQVNVAQDKQTVAIGAGSRWIDVYLKLDALSLATSGGRSATVGVGGLTLGGKESSFHA